MRSLRRHPFADPNPRLLLAPLAAIPLWTGCVGDAGGASTAWAGRIDTLPSGQVVVANPKEPLWSEGAGWTVREDLRIGALDEPGPYEFAQIRALDVDAAGRIWVLEAQAKEIRVFDADGRHVRTVGRSGEGPGEFSDPTHAGFGPEGRLWVADPANNRISVIDTAGAFVESHPMEGGFLILPWPGRFDLDGHYYLPVIRIEPGGGSSLKLVRHGPGFVPLDTLGRPSDPVERDWFEIKDDEGRTRVAASIPFAPGFRTLLSPQATFWGLFTDEYRLVEISRTGDTLRTIRKGYDPLPVTAADREAARERLSWFTEQGGRADMSKIPDVKPVAETFFVDDEGRIWVARLTDRPTGRDYDLFDAEGRFLGPVELPVPLPAISRVRGDDIYGVTRDDLDVPYVVRLRIERGSAASPTSR